MTVTNIIAIGLAIGCFLAELVLRIINFSTSNFYRIDFHTGAALREGAQRWWTTEGRAYVRIDRDGLRDQEHPKSKASNTYRIAVLGDSYAEAMQVPMEHAFWAEYAERNRIHLHGFDNGGGHWNFNVHQLAGKLIAREVCSSLLIPDLEL